MFFPGGTQPSWKITELPGGALHVGEGGGGGMDNFLELHDIPFWDKLIFVGQSFDAWKRTCDEVLIVSAMKVKSWDEFTAPPVKRK